MVTVGLLVRIEARPGRETDVERFLEDALGLVEQEPDTTAWFAVRMGPSSYAIFDVFPGQAAREAHLGGQVATTLLKRADELLSEPPRITELDVLAAKLPRQTPASEISGG